MCVFYFINYSAWNQPSLSHAKREGSKDPKADDNLEHGRKIFQHDISGILGYKLCTRHINRLHNIFFKYVSILVDFLPFRSFPIFMSYFCIKVLIGSSQRKVYANQIHETKATSVCLFHMGFLHFDEYLLI